MASHEHIAKGTSFSLPRADHLSLEDKRRMIYRTNHSVSHTHGTKMFAPVGSFVKGENMKEVHFMGQRKSKYMSIQPRDAPLHHRSDTQHSQTHRGIGPMDLQSNAEIVASFREKRLPDVPQTYSKTTLYQADFRQAKPEEIEMSRTVNMPPDPGSKSERVLCGVGENLVLNSTMQDTHAAPYLGVKYAGENQRPPDELCKNRGRTICAKDHVTEEMMRSSYRGHFGPAGEKRRNREEVLAAASKTAKMGETLKFTHSLSSPSLMIHK